MGTGPFENQRGTMAPKAGVREGMFSHESRYGVRALALASFLEEHMVYLL